MKESSLHKELKDYYTLSGDVQEAQVDGYIIDILRGSLLIEIQTRNFSSIKSKLETLVQKYPVRLIHPISQEKWITKQYLDQPELVTRRRSPSHGRWESVFNELIRLPQVIVHPNFSLEIVLVKLEEVRINDNKGSWRRAGWSIYDRHLIEVLGSRLFAGPPDYLALLPVSLPIDFTITELAALSRLSYRLAARMTYVLRRMGLISSVGKRGRSNLYRINKGD